MRPGGGHARDFAGVLPDQHVVRLPRIWKMKRRSIACSTATATRSLALVVEPSVQGAGGMIFHDSDVLPVFADSPSRHDVLLIFDEIFTGFGRTGPLFACERAGVTPTSSRCPKHSPGGTLPLSAAWLPSRVRGFLVRRSANGADARPHLYGEPARVCRCERVARSV